MSSVADLIWDCGSGGRSRRSRLIDASRVAVSANNRAVPCSAGHSRRSRRIWVNRTEARARMFIVLLTQLERGCEGGLIRPVDEYDWWGAVGFFEGDVELVGSADVATGSSVRSMWSSSALIGWGPSPSGVSALGGHFLC